MKTNINITIDGGAGVGKGTITKLLAQKIGLQPIDSGAMYRVCSYLCNKELIEPQDVTPEFLNRHEFSYKEFRLHIDEIFVEELPIRTQLNSNLSSKYATQKVVREFVTQSTQKIMENKGFILEGRDSGTVVCPSAEIKLYIESPIEIRAQRRLQDYKKQGLLFTQEEIIQELEERDHQDKTRELDPLTIPKNALMISNGDLPIDELIESIATRIKEVLSKK